MLYYNLGGRLSREVLRSRGGQYSELQHRYDLLGNREATVLPDGRTLNTLTYGSGHVRQVNLLETVMTARSTGMEIV